MRVRCVGADEWCWLRGHAKGLTYDRLRDVFTADPGVDSGGNPAVVMLPKETNPGSVAGLGGKRFLGVESV